MYHNAQIKRLERLKIALNKNKYRIHRESLLLQMYIGHFLEKKFKKFQKF